MVLLVTIATAQTLPTPATPAGLCELRKGDSRIEFAQDRGSSVTALEINTTGFTFSLPPGGELARPLFTRKAMEEKPPALAFSAPTATAPAGTGTDTSRTWEVLLTEANSDEGVSGLRYKHAVRLADKGQYLEFTETLTNPTTDIMGAQFGIRNVFELDAVKGQSTAFLPTERNILHINGDSIDRFYARNTAWDFQPAASWLAMLNEGNRTGLVFILEPAHLDGFYAKTAYGTCGWLWDGGILKPGCTFTTTWWLVPVKEFSGIVHASRRLLADLQVKTAAGGLELTHLLAGVEKPLGEVTVKTAVYGARTKKTTDLAAIKLTAGGLDPVSGKILLDQPQSEPLVIRVEVTGKDWSESYETYREGEFHTTIYPGYPYEPEYRRPKLKKN